MKIKPAKLALAGAVLLILAGCGGGGSSDSPVSGTPPATVTLSGVAATGAPFAGAAVTVTDATGATVCSTSTDAAGIYNCGTLSSTAKAPFVIKVTRDDISYYSATASTTGGTANVTPLTTIIVAKLSPDGNPASLAGAIVTTPTLVTAATVQAQTTELRTALAPVLSALGLPDSLDLISGALTANGTGQDKLLDNLSVSVLPTGSSSNIEITAKTATPVSIAYNTGSTAPTFSTPITATDLAATPTPAMVADLMNRLTACYALPLTQRVSTATSDTISATSGTATDVKDAACKALFLNDDPATFYGNGSSVGYKGAWSSLFSATSTGTVYDRGNFEFARTTGDLVLSFRWATPSTGYTDNETLIAQNVNGTLKLVGNGYDYSASVRPQVEHRDLINSTDYSWYATGYHVAIKNKTSSGNSIFSKVVVTASDGAVYTYVPSPGKSNLVLQRNGVATGTEVIRLRGEYAKSATTGNPADLETGQFFVSSQLTDAQISAAPNLSAWKLDFYLASAPTVVAATQTYRTLSRALTIAEIRQLAFVDLTPTMRSERVTDTAATGYYYFSTPDTVQFDTNAGLDAWTVPTGALAPSSFLIYGKTSAGVRFDDSTSLSSQARKAVLSCSKQTTSDLHCDSATPTLYATGDTVNLAELWVRNARQVEISKKFGLYKLP